MNCNLCNYFLISITVSLITVPCWAMFPFGPDGMFGPGFPFGPGGFNIGEQIQDSVQSNLANMMHSLQKQQSNFQKNMQDWRHNFNIQMDDLRQTTSVIGIMAQMSHGAGGTTIARFNGEEILIKDGVNYLCQGEILIPRRAEDGVQCTGPLKRAQSNVCYPGGSRMSMNGKVCIGENIYMSSINGNVQCENGELYDIEELREKCGQTYGTNHYIHYEYFPMPGDARAVPIPNSNKYLPCHYSNISCSWTADESGLNTN